MTYQLHHGNLLDILPMMERDSIDAIVTDPPYGLDFMGKDWDHGVPGEHFWREAWRVAKPGAHLLAFGGTRTFHRLACAIEDAGWEMRDCVMWVYGCLSEDTEILTIKGWEHYHKTIADNPVLCYNIEDDSFHFDKPIREFCYENQHPAYRIQSDHTDQIVSRNHRVIVERGGRKAFAYAETLEQQESVPILESLSDLPEVIPNLYEGTSIQKQDLLARLRDSSNARAAHTEANERTQDYSDQVRSVRQGSLQAGRLVKEDRYSHLFKSLQWCFKKSRIGKAFSQGTRCMDGRKSKELRRENERCEQSRLERWGDLLSQAWQLCADQIRALPEGVFGYGAQRWVCDGASLNHGAIFGQAITAGGSSASYQSRSDRQQDRESNAVQHESRSQVIRGTQATVTPIEYIGKMWCVSVPTGAFVARRNGHIFITGNSGFPKSHDVSKAIDREAGAEREVVGKRKQSFGLSENLGWNKNSLSRTAIDIPIELPATEQAQEWDGWGTALKPAWEPIIVARKPLQGTVAENVQRYGTGALNIDQCRIMPQDQQHDAYAYKRLSLLYSDAYKQVLNPATSLDSLRHIVSALRSCSIDGIDHLRSEGDQGDTLNIPAEYVTLATVLFPNGAWCALTGYKVQDSLADCLPYHHLHDEYIHALTMAAQESPASLADALSHICREQLEHTRNHDYQDTDRPSNSDAYLPTFCVSFLLNVLKHYTTYLSPRQAIWTRDNTKGEALMYDGWGMKPNIKHGSTQDRWPANLIHDGSAEVLAGFPVTNGNGGTPKRGNIFGGDGESQMWNYGDTGSAARFFYCAKASKQDRDEGCEGLEPRIHNDGRDESLASGDMPQNRSNNPDRNFHPTVKPTALMRYLCRLVTPPAGVILDPFMGSGSTGKAAILEGFNFIGVDTQIEYVEIAARRIEHACEKVGIVVEQPMMFETKRETVDRPKQLILL